MKKSNQKFVLQMSLCSIFIFLFSVQIGWGQQRSITVTNSEGQHMWVLETKNMSYILKVNNKQLHQLYYGQKIESENLIPYYAEEKPEIPVRGGSPSKLPIVEVVFSDGTRDLELIYDDFNIKHNEGYALLQIRMKDSYYPFVLTVNYKVVEEYDIIEKWIEVKNLGSDNIKVENLMSGSLWLTQGAYEMTHITGIYLHDFQPETALLTKGVKTIESKNFKTYGSSYFTLTHQGEKNLQNGSTWYGQLHYSGNWRTDFESMPNDEVQVVSGINFWDTELNLEQNESFSTPIFCFGFTPDGTDAVARNFSDYIRNLIIPEKRNKHPRPVIYNSWYATGFNINEQQQLSLAKVAKEIGVEMFVIDDGWFKGRIDSRGGLGDWTVDKNKFPNGLNPLINQVNKMGMDFGIWIEPEMVNPNSDLYRNHPDWVLHFQNRKRTEGRNQLMLNLARKDVFDYLYDSYFELLSNHNIRFVKWDMNKELTEPGWPEADATIQREVRIRYIENLYKLIDKLTNAFPDVWFETCSSGGGRVDIEILKRTDFAWVSDNIDPVDRIFIQYGYLGAFPANTMISWTGYHDFNGVSPSLDFRFDVAMSGVLGIGNDIAKWEKEEIDIAKAKITLYKNIRETIHNGRLYRLSSPFESNRAILQFNSDDKNKSVIFCYKLEDHLKGSTSYPYQKKYFKLMGLIPDALYKIDDGNEIFKGSDLMNIGIKFPSMKIGRAHV